VGETPPDSQTCPPVVSFEAPPCRLSLGKVHDGR